MFSKFKSKIYNYFNYIVSHNLDGLSENQKETSSLLNALQIELSENQKETSSLLNALQIELSENQKETSSLLNALQIELSENQKEVLTKINNSQKDISMINSKLPNLIKTEFRSNVDLSLMLRWIAAEETAQYILDNMNMTQSFSTDTDLREFSVRQSDKKGLYIEFGVYSGRTINEISACIPDIMVYGFDSFDGLPADWRTGFNKSTFSKNEMPKVNENVVLIKGLFEDTLSPFLEEHSDDISFLHIDVDIYSSAKTVLMKCRNRIRIGTVILFDEFFNYPGWKNHEFKAFIEFIEETNYNYDFIGYVPSWEQVAVRIK